MMKHFRKKFSFRRFLTILAVLLLILFLFLTLMGFRKATVYGTSMEPTLREGETVWVDRITYRFRKPERMDVIIFHHDGNRGRYYIKRIMGLPGETVQIKDGKIFADGKVIEENPERERIEDARMAEAPLLVPEDSYFVLGDNRNQSTDSRDFNIGMIPKDEIIGRVMAAEQPERAVNGKKGRKDTTRWQQEH